jgi:hypothetical protein
MMALIVFSFMLFRASAPAGRARVFGCGRFCGGSAGSGETLCAFAGALVCAPAAVASENVSPAKRAARLNSLPVFFQNLFIVVAFHLKSPVSASAF